jgi:hypothetical protein
MAGPTNTNRLVSAARFASMCCGGLAGSVIGLALAFAGVYLYAVFQQSLETPQNPGRGGAAMMLLIGAAPLGLVAGAYGGGLAARWLFERFRN